MSNPRTHRHARRILAALVVASAGAALASDAGSAQPKAVKAPINVLYVATESGPLAAVGRAFLNGAVAGARIINASGGILGHPITMKIVDSASDGSKAVGLVQQELNSGKQYSMVVTDVGGIAIPVFPIVVQHSNILFTGAAQAVQETPQSCPTCYFAAPLQSTIAGGAVWWAKKLGYKSIGFAAIDNASGRSWSDAFKSMAQKYGLGYSEAFAPAGTIDGTPQLQRVLANHPDALVFPGSGGGPLFLPARLKLGATDVPVVCDQSCAGSTDWTAITADGRANIKMLAVPFLIEGNKATGTFAFKQYLRYLNKLESSHPLGLNAGLTSYEDMMLMRVAARKCNCIDGGRWAKVLETVHSASSVPGWIGPPTLFAPGVRAPVFPPSYYQLVPAKPLTPQGLWSAK
jgi:hypothetical protein